MKKVFILLVMVAVFGFTGVASATLTTIGTATYDGSDYKLIYEDDQGLIWLDYSKGPNHWEIQMDWVSGLNVSGVLTYNLNPGISVYWGGDWRLPESGWDIGYYKTTSEMGHLYYMYYISLGNKG